MKNILRIAKIELGLLFYSPVAWIVLLVFIIQSGWLYMSILERMEQAQQMGMTLSGMTDRMFSGFAGLFPKMQEYLYLYIPLLTMGLISRETQSGSIKLLYSSPIKASEIVLGKYLAMMGYCLLLLSVLLALGVLSLFTINNVDFPHIVSGIIGLYLLICAYSAIGLFMSSLTTYQVVAAISTLVVLAALNFIGGLWQGIAFVRDITYFLSISGRAEESIRGLIGSHDVLYFLIVITLFLGLTYLKLQSERQTISLGRKVLNYTSFIAVMLLLGYVGSRPQFVVYKDMTGNARRTLTKNSQDIIAKFEEPVVMTTYVNLLDEMYAYGLPTSQNNDKKHFEMYFRFMPYLKMDYVYYWDHSTNERLYKENPGLSDEEIAKKMARATQIPFEKFLPPKEIRKVIDLSPERNRLVRTLKYKDRDVFLRMFDDIVKYPGEKETSAALKRLVAEAPKVGFLTGHGERSIHRAGDRDYQVATNEIAFRYALINQGFDILDVDLSKAAVDSGIKIMVIADPSKPFDVLELERLKEYIDRGDNLMIAGEPGSNAILDPVLAMLGVAMEKGMLVQQSQNFDADFVLSGIAKQNWINTMGESDFLKRDSVFVTTPGVAALSFRPTQGFSALPILVTQAANSWLQPDVTLSRNAELTDERTNEEKKSYVTALAISRKIDKTEQRILVFGDTDFMSNAEVRRQAPRSANFSFVTELFKWFSYGEFPIDTSRPEQADVGVLIDSDEVNYIKWGWVGLLPALIALSVSTMLLVRKRR